MDEAPRVQLRSGRDPDPEPEAEHAVHYLRIAVKSRSDVAVKNTVDLGAETSRLDAMGLASHPSCFI